MASPLLKCFLWAWISLTYLNHWCNVLMELHFNWTPAADAAFRELKEELAKAPVLGYPTPDDHFVVDTNASLSGVGAVLSQLQEGQARVISYYSTSLSNAESYCATKKELLAVIKAIWWFHPYLYGQPFTLRTDHAALCWLLNFWWANCQVVGGVTTVGGASTRDEAYQYWRSFQTSRCGQWLQILCKAWRHRGTPKEGPWWIHLLFHCRYHWNSDRRWSQEELREAQMRDTDIQRVLWWKEGETRPTWQMTAPHSEATKSYWSQWESLLLEEGVLYKPKPKPENVPSSSWWCRRRWGPNYFSSSTVLPQQGTLE